MCSLRKPCVNKPNSFCYVYGKFDLQKQRKMITEFVIKSYEAYFGRKLAEKDKYWVPNIICKSCFDSFWTTDKLREYPSSITSHQAWANETVHQSLNKTGDCFKHVCQTIPALSMEKLNAGIFDGPQIHTLMKDTVIL